MKFTPLLHDECKKDTYEFSVEMKNDIPYLYTSIACLLIISSLIPGLKGKDKAKYGA